MTRSYHTHFDKVVKLFSFSIRCRI